jgi:hypothetical protein
MIPAFDYSIPKLNFEIIRERIGLICFEELEKQKELATDPDDVAALEKVNVFLERFQPIGQEDMIVIEPFLFQGTFDQQHLNHTKGIYNYYLDCFGRAAAYRNEEGEIVPADIAAAKRLQRIAAMLVYIFTAGEYESLGFPRNVPGGQCIVEHSHVIDLKRTEEQDFRDSTGIIMYRIILQVKAPENTRPVEGTPLSDFVTDVCIGETEIGLQYQRRTKESSEANASFFATLAGDS